MSIQEQESQDSAAQEILGYSFLRVIAGDGILDEEELETIERLALRDGVVDSKERAVLARIFDRMDPTRLDTGVRDAIRQFREEHGIR